MKVKMKMVIMIIIIMIASTIQIFDSPSQETGAVSSLFALYYLANNVSQTMSNDGLEK